MFFPQSFAIYFFMKYIILFNNREIQQETFKSSDLKSK